MIVIFNDRLQLGLEMQKYLLNAVASIKRHKLGDDVLHRGIS